MFREAFVKLELEDVATILDQVNPLLEGTPFDPVETTVLAQDLSFYPGYQLVEISDQSISPPLVRHVLYKPDDVVVLDWSNKPIYDLNGRAPIKLDEMNVCDYAYFFFTYVRGQHGRFIIVQNVDDIDWKEEPPPAARKAIGKMLEPLNIKEKAKNGVYHLEARVVFKDSLFKTDIYVEPNGQITLADEELLIEDMPILDDTFGQ